MLLFGIPKDALRWTVQESVSQQQRDEARVAMRELEIASIRAALISICIAVLFYVSARQIVPILQFPVINFVAYTTLFGVVSTIGFRLNEYVVAKFPKMLEARPKKYAFTEQKIFLFGHQNPVRLLREYKNFRLIHSDTKEVTGVQLIKYPHALNLPLPEEPMKTQVLNIVQEKLTVWGYEKTPEEYMKQFMYLESPYDLIFYAASLLWAIFLGRGIEQSLSIYHWNVLFLLAFLLFIGPGTYWASKVWVRFDRVNAPKSFQSFFLIVLFGNLLSASLGIIYIMLFYIHRILP
jgi:hypothetical protein